MEGQAFCNFDYGTSGFCELCSLLNLNSTANRTCEYSGFSDEKGKTECENICEGIFIYRVCKTKIEVLTQFNGQKIMN